MGNVSIVEIPYETGEMRFRYIRRLSEDKAKWVRHGLFRAYHRNGNLASEGAYKDGLEDGVWRDFHENGQLAAEGAFVKGEQDGVWRYWDINGVEEL